MATIKTYRGDTVKLLIHVVVKDSNPSIPFVLSGYTAKFSLKLKDTDFKTIFTIDGNVVDDINGIISVEISPTLTKKLMPTKYVYDVEIANATRTDVHTVAKGYFAVINDVTVL